MKLYIYVLFVIITFTSCQKEVILDNTKNITPRLVVEANINLNKDNEEPSNFQTVKLTKSASFYNQEYPKVTNAKVAIYNDEDESMGTFTYDDKLGLYICRNFKKPTLGKKFHLKIELNGELYTASDVYTPIINPNHIKQDSKVSIVSINVENSATNDFYYLFKIENSVNKKIRTTHRILEDLFYNKKLSDGNYDVFLGSEFSKNDVIKISTYGISENYNEFLRQVTLASEGGSSNPFSTTTKTSRGNITNQTNKENFAYGFFSVNQFTYTEYVVIEGSDDVLITDYESK